MIFFGGNQLHSSANIWKSTMETVDFTVRHLSLPSQTAHLRIRASLHHSPFDLLERQPGDELTNSTHLIQLSSHLRPQAPQLQSVSQFMKYRRVCLSAPVSVSYSLKDKPHPPHNYKHHSLPDLSFGSHFNQLHPPDFLPAELPAGVRRSKLLRV